MKKQLMVLAVILGLVSSASAQPVGFGIKAGADLATEAADTLGPNYSESFRLGFNGGIFTVFSLADFIEFQPELQFIQKGFQSHASHVLVSGGGGSVYTSVNDSITANYLEIPLAFNFGTPLGSGWEGNLQVGPTMAFLLSGNEYTDAGSYGSSNHDITDEFTSFEAGFLLGAGLRTGNWLLDARYERGLTSVNSYSGGDAVVNSLFTLQLGYRLF